MPNFGTLSMADLLQQTSGQVAQLDEQDLWSVFKVEVGAHNETMRQVVSEFATPTTSRLVGIGGLTQMEMQDLDEWATPDVQKITAGENLGFPLRNSGIAVQWTRLARLVMTPADMAAQFLGVLSADRRRVIRNVKRALYTATNYTFVDVRMKDRAVLSVKALANADGMSIPVGPNGEVFTAATHNHYMGTASFAAADLSALILNVAEHWNTGDIRVVINQAQEATVRAFTGFVPLTDARIINATTLTVERGDLDVARRYDRMIGVYDGAEIWVKYWAIPNYVVAYNRGVPKVLAFRYREGGTGDLVLQFEDEMHPFQAKEWERESGFGVRNRVAAAVLQTNNATYSSPAVA